MKNKIIQNQNSKTKETRMVRLAQSGDANAFENLVISYQRKIYGYAMYHLKNEHNAQEIVQNTFLKAFIKLRTLKKPESFSQWLLTICKNGIYEFIRNTNREIQMDNQLLTSLLESRSREIEQEWETYFDVLRLAIALLKTNLKEVIQLRYFAGLSYQEISLVCGIDVKLVKSRLYEAKAKIKIHIPHLHEGVSYNFKQIHISTEEIMKTTQQIKLAAYIFERLALRQQIKICQLVKSGAKFDESLLTEIAWIKNGKEFIKKCDARLNLAELINILTYVDYGTLERTVGYLEENDNEFAETIKQNMFIFEDIVLLDHHAIKILHDKIDDKILQTALANSSPTVRKVIIDVIPDHHREQWIQEIIDNTPYHQDVHDAQYQVINEIYNLVDNGVFKVKRSENAVKITPL